MRTLAVIASAIVALASSARAQARFEVDRTRIDLSEAGPTGALTITNHGHEALRLSLTAFAWRDDADGAMQLAPTTDVVVRPGLVEIAPGSSRVVRVGTTLRAGSLEASYRVFAEELPDRRALVPGTIAVRTRVGIPIFVAPRGSAGVGDLAPTVAFEPGRAVVTVKPAGALHVKLASVTVRALVGGKLRWHHEVNGWYVLPGQARRFAVELGTDNCAGVDEVVAEVVGEDGARWLGPPTPCR